MPEGFLIPAGTGEGTCARIYVAISQGHRAKEGRSNNRRHSAHLLWKRVEFCVMLVAHIIVAGIGISDVLRTSTKFSKWAILDSV